MFSRSLARVFQEALAREPFFEDWEKEKPREYWSRSGERAQGIDLQFDKWWEKTGGKVAVNLWVGHRWSTPSWAWREDGVEYANHRLSPTDGDHWWTIRSEDQVTAFRENLTSLLPAKAVPWFRQVATKNGYLAWVLENNPAPAGFPYILELQGEDAAKQQISNWLLELPSGIQSITQWMTEAGLASPDLSRRIWLASIQSVDQYRARIPALAQELMQGG